MIEKINRFFSVTLYIMLIAMCLFFAAEIYLRLCGVNLQWRQEFAHNTVPTFLQGVRAQCAWGLDTHSVPSYEDMAVCENVTPLGSRYSGRKVVFQGTPDAQVLLLGCSYTFGIGIKDNQTFAYTLNKRFPQIVTDNYGVRGWGTFQSLILENALLNDTKYNLVIYGCIWDHINRNTVKGVIGQLPVNNAWFVRPNVDILYGELRFHSTNSYFWPGEDRFVTVDFLKRVFFGYLTEHSSLERDDLPDPKSPAIERERERVFIKLTERMAKEAKDHKAKFAVACFDKKSLAILQRDKLHRYDLLDLSDPRLDTPAFHVNGRMNCHPNGKANRVWADKLTAYYLKQFYSQPNQPRPPASAVNY